MKNQYQQNITDRLRKLADTTTQYVDERIKAGYASIAPYLLSPQWTAGFSGLKKLVEKDYSDEEEAAAGSMVSS